VVDAEKKRISVNFIWIVAEGIEPHGLAKSASKKLLCCIRKLKKEGIIIADGGGTGGSGPRK